MSTEGVQAKLAELIALEPTLKPRRVSVRGVIFKDGKLLCVKHRDSKTGATASYAATPGGGVEPGESLIAGVERELVEELGVAPKVGKLLFFQQFIDRRGVEEFDFFFHVENPEDFASIDLSKTTHGLKELAFAGFLDPQAEPTILPAFLKQIDIADYIARDRPVVILNNLSEVGV